MNELRKMFPIQIVRGALLRPDGVAVGLVSGGAPAWDLLSRAARGQAGSEYHRLLLSLDAPIDLYVIDQPPDLAGEIAALLSRRDSADTPVLTAVRSASADYLTELASQSGSRAKQAIWAVTAMSGVGARGVSRLNLPSLIGHHARYGSSRRRSQSRAFPGAGAGASPGRRTQPARRHASGPADGGRGDRAPALQPRRPRARPALWADWNAA